MDIDLFEPVNSFYGNVKLANSKTSSNKMKSKENLFLDVLRNLTLSLFFKNYYVVC